MSRTFDKDLNDLTQQLGATKIPLNGVAFVGQGLKLNNAEDAKPVIDAINSLVGPLEFLNLEGNTIGVEAAEAIAKALEDKPALRHALWKDMFTSRLKTEIPPALKALSKALMKAGARLEVLDLSDNASGPIGVDGISDLLTSEVCWGLKELRLANMGLGIGGAQKLAKALQKCYDNSKAAGSPFALKVFIAGRNRLENPGCIALSQVFKQIGTLEQIQIYQNGIYHQGIKALSEALENNPNLRVLDLNDNTITYEGAVHLSKALRKLPNITTLNLGDCLLRSEGAKMIATAIKESLPRLEELIMSSNEISGKVGLLIAEALASKKTLRSAYLGENGFGSHLEQIEEIILAAHDYNPEFVLNIDDNEDDEEEEGEVEGEEDYEEETSEGEMNDEENEEDYDLDEENEDEGDSEGYSGDEYVTMLDTTSPMKRNFQTNSEALPFLTLDLSSPKGCYDQINERLQGKPDDEQIEELLASIMYISSQMNEKSEAVDVGINLYQKLFTVAGGSSLSLVNNLLPGYLGLIKFEKKELSKYFDSASSQTLLQKAMSQGFFPKATVDTLTFLLNRETNNN